MQHSIVAWYLAVGTLIGLVGVQLLKTFHAKEPQGLSDAHLARTYTLMLLCFAICWPAMIALFFDDMSKAKALLAAKRATREEFDFNSEMERRIRLSLHLDRIAEPRKESLIKAPRRRFKAANAP